MSVDVEKIVREHIDRTVHMSLATSKDNKPWVCEVHFVYDDRLNLYFRSLMSRRHSQEIALNPSVAGNIVKQHAVGEAGQGIYFEGMAEHIEDDDERQGLFPLFRSRLGAGENIIDDARREDGAQFYKITVENWYAFGKFDGDVAEKYKLVWNGKQQ